MIYELNALASNAYLRYNVWGLDQSGALQGAGGVGGLLGTYEFANAIVAIPMYDAMGNIHGLINSGTGAVMAAYEYDAFGNTLRESGTYAANNPFRYSTKYTDIETGLVYYGNRYYSPSLGRFINKDPIEESGGLNLYGFCGNNGVNGYDLLGMLDQNSSLDDFLAVYKDPDTAKLMYEQRPTLGWSHNFAHGPWDAIISSPFSGNDQMNAQMYGGGGPAAWITLFDDHQNFQGPMDKLGSSAAQDQAAYQQSVKDYAATHPSGSTGTNNPSGKPALPLTPIKVTPKTASPDPTAPPDSVVGAPVSSSSDKGQYSGMVIQVTMSDGHSYIPMSHVKSGMSQTTGAPEGMPTPFFYPTSKPGPQQLVAYWKATNDAVMNGSIDSRGALSAIAMAWAPMGPGDWKKMAPLEVYDETANFMYAATASTMGIPLSTLWQGEIKGSSFVVCG